MQIVNAKIEENYCHKVLLFLLYWHHHLFIEVKFIVIVNIVMVSYFLA